MIACRDEAMRLSEKKVKETRESQIEAIERTFLYARCPLLACSLFAWLHCILPACCCAVGWRVELCALLTLCLEAHPSVHRQPCVMPFLLPGAAPRDRPRCGRTPRTCARCSCSKSTPTSSSTKSESSSCPALLFWIVRCCLMWQLVLNRLTERLWRIAVERVQSSCRAVARAGILPDSCRLASSSTDPRTLLCDSHCVCRYTLVRFDVDTTMAAEADSSILK